MESGPPGLTIRKALTGKILFLTGVTGYIGSVILEQLLRCCPGVSRIYVLARGRRGQTAQQRVQRLLASGLFHMLHDKPGIFLKVVVVEGDLLRPDLGIQECVREVLQTHVDAIIHCAADIALENETQTSLQTNYLGTKAVLDLAASVLSLQAFIHVSSAYANANQPKGSTVMEQLYPLYFGDQVASHEEVALSLLSGSKSDSAIRAACLMDKWGFPNIYTLTKHLAEQLVAAHHNKPFPVAIVRPSLVGAIHGLPYPGYFGNFAGPTGYGLAFGLGMFGWRSVAWQGATLTDGIPADMVASVIIAGAAALLQPTALHSGQLEGPLVMHAASSTSHPVYHLELWRMARRFFKYHPFPYRLQVGNPMKEFPGYKPHPALVSLAKGWTWTKVGAVVMLLKLVGKGRVARKLKLGHRQWADANCAKNDMNLYFSVKNVLLFDANLDAGECADFRLLWSPKTGSWKRYNDTYMIALHKMVFDHDVKTTWDHDFVYHPAAKYAIQVGELVTGSS